MLVGEPVQHHRGREDHPGRIGLALPHDIRRGAVAWLEHGVAVADIRRRRHAEAADQARGDVGDDVAEHVLHHHHVEIPGTLDEKRRAGVDVEAVGFDVRMPRRCRVEHLAEERKRLEHVGLVDAGQRARPAARLAPFRQPK